MSELEESMLRGALLEALWYTCGEEPSHETLNTSLIMIKDQDVMDMIGVFYMIMEFFFLDKQVDLGPEFSLANLQVYMGPDIDRKLDTHELLDLIKSRNNAYSPVTTETCKAMYLVLNSSHYRFRLPVSCRGRRWFAVGLAFSFRGSDMDEDDEWGTNAISIYRQMVEESDELEASQEPALGTQVGEPHGFDQLSEPKVK